MPVSSGLKKTWGERGALLCPEAGDREWGCKEGLGEDSWDEGPCVSNSPETPLIKQLAPKLRPE